MSDKVELPTTNQRPDRCETCRYYHSDHEVPALIPGEARTLTTLREVENYNGSRVGECRRYPPVKADEFPQPWTTDWCGEWKAKLKATPCKICGEPCRRDFCSAACKQKDYRRKRKPK